MDTHDNPASKYGDDLPPDRAAQGDMSTTGHSSEEAPGGAPTAHADDAHAGHGSSGGHGADTSDVSTLVPTNWAQLILPAIILVFVAILVAGPVINAFAPRPAASAPAEQSGTENTGVSSGTSEGTPVQSVATSTEVPATATTAPTLAPATATASPAAGLQVSGTQTAVAVAGEKGEVARVPQQLQFAGVSFGVQQGGDLLPDWNPPSDAGTATWIANTVANHILYIPYSSQNEEIFKGTKPGDVVKLAMNTGQVFSFTVTRSDRAINGPATSAGQFTVSAAMAQDHAGVTLFLIGDPSPDRAVVQADFNGTIQ